MIADVDKDGSGAIEFEEFVQMMTAKIGERDTKEELVKAFRLIDHDNNVSINSCLPSTYSTDLYPGLLGQLKTKILYLSIKDKKYHMFL
jgi:EF hand